MNLSLRKKIPAFHIFIAMKKRVTRRTTQISTLLLILFVLTVPRVSLWAQLPEAVSLTTLNGLPSNNVYYIHQDRQGYIWMTTDKGVCRYDGMEVEVFTRKNGLTDNECYSIFEDSRGRIWFGTSNGQPCFFYEGKFFNPLNYPALGSIFISGYISNFAESNSGDMYITGQNHGIYKLTSTDEVIDLSTPDLVLSLLVTTDSGDFGANRRFTRLISLDSLHKPKEIIDLSKIPKKGYGHKSVVSDLLPYAVTVSIGTHYALGFSLTTHQQLPINFWKVPENTFLVNVAYHPKHGLFLVGKKNIYVFTPQDLPLGGEPSYSIPLGEYTGAHVMFDNEDNMWVATRENGALYFPTPLVKALPKESATEKPPLHLLKVSEDTLYTLNNNGEIYRWTPEGSSLFSKLPFLPENRGKLTPAHEPGSLWCYATTGLFHIAADGKYTLIKSSFFSVFQATKKGLVIGVSKMTMQYTNGPGKDTLWHTPPAELSQLKLIQVLDDVDFTFRSRSSVVINPDSILLGYQYGLAAASFSTQSISPLAGTRSLGLIGSLTKSIDQDSTPWVWMGGSELLLGVSSQNDTIRVAPTLLEGETVNHTQVIGDSLLFASTTKGLIYFQLDYPQKEIRYLGGISEYQGLPSLVVFKTEVVADSLWIATTEGIVTAEIANLLNSRSPSPEPPKVKSILIDNEPVPANREVTVAPEAQIVSIKLAALHYASQGQIVMEYRLTPEDDWTPTASTELQFVGLGKGKYPLQIRTVSIQGDASLPLELTLIKQGYWWLEIWFWVSAISLLTLGCIFFIRWRNLRLQNRTKSALQMAQLELKALKAQMNPHFIFNALSSIQRFILANDPKHANDYLTKYSRLTRMVLNHSEKTFVPLADEIQLLTYYIELEALRLKHRFTFEILVDPNLASEQVTLPSMLLQTYIENAIWHGLSSLPQGGKIEIRFERLRDTLQIVIEDNGIGREAAMIRNPRKGTSKGSQITADKLDMLNRTIYQNRAALRIQDKYDSDEKPAGTRVILTIPLI
ncbi:MAG TPA: hypothetical protein DCE41_27820 [Cytophagales bacterium]|nr:hypothetical protein [Cytophagales bacterium]HAA22746.1 hypothetical protein [Cytophagales bacterium]HAP63838.1 hypothetical protein [Cytophagales bacterium]